MKEGLTDPDEVPEPPDEAITQPGDLWILGDHRLLCGDSSKPEDVDRLLDGATIHLVNTDPPYNVKVEPRSNNAIAAGQQFVHRTTITSSWTWPGTRRRRSRPHARCGPRTGRWPTTSSRTRSSTGMLHAWFGNMARVLEPGRGFYIWGGYANCGNYPPVLKASELYFCPGDHLGQGASGADPQGLHGRTTSGVSTAGRKALATSSSGPNNATDLWHVKKVNPQQDGPFDGEARRAGRAGDAVLVACRRERAWTCSAAAAAR